MAKYACEEETGPAPPQYILLWACICLSALPTRAWPAVPAALHYLWQYTTENPAWSSGPQGAGRGLVLSCPPGCLGPGIVVFNAAKSSSGQLNSSLECVQQLELHGNQDLCPMSSQTRRSHDHWLTLRSHVGPLKILTSVFPLGLW